MNKNKSIELEFPLTKYQVLEFPDITFYQPYGSLKNIFNLKLDLLKPNDDAVFPLVVFVTGGGFFLAPKYNYLQQRVALAEAGFIVASIEYRVIPQGKFPDALVDVKNAIRFLKANASKFGIDKEKVAIMGESAGGYLAALTATTNNCEEFEIGENLNESSSVQAAIDIYGLSDLTKVGDDFSKEVQEAHASPASPEAILINGLSLFSKGGSIEDNLDLAQKANPLNYVSENTPPFLLMHGDKDGLVSPSQTEILFEALLEKGVDAHRYIVKNANHADKYWYQPKVTDIIIEFLNKNLK
ncbi:alpha/beta hydrolase [Candidatus Cetobacterium colombiensis]|uniref:Alpha/beta hydrolase n=1 Tax=Candidatus Cetobacterium colombiensis TaxID=3073100 RepID=A0ABU4WAR9_9FUSO|nr:alpha/beta hydrolase [Candidatus Cetobacterium colombiensis]MDX8336648.1 alpha/beta hydrolase [Candidatus Cetobacterium colombiensis]